jgi:hypothetical protein
MWHFRHYNQGPDSAPTVHLSHILGSHFQTRKVKNVRGPKRTCHYNQGPRSAPTIHLSHILGSHFQTRKVKNV